ncbi:MAG: BT_3928 family protein [Alistipes putredinis]|uniref:BT_3928 family protein n=1 Tax=Alistipes putredinis TaxID=28117 RepID=UPI0030202218
MMKPMLSQRARSLITGVCRLVLAVVFIVSGFTKVIDPWGTSIKINEYLTIYGFDYLIPASMVFSIWLCGAEMMMGCMLLCKVRIRLVSIFALVSMLFFTILTFLSATFIPVEDCGCFGEAIKLSPWETFFKNLALLPMAAVVWAYYRNDKILAFRRSEVALTVFFFLLTMGLGFYCYCHLPLIDFLPYKIGVNIREEMHASSAAGPEGELQTVLVYRNRMTGEEREFALDDTEWQDDTVWEWVDTKILGEVPEMNPMIEEFALRNGAEDVTDRVLATPGRLYLICVTRFDCIGRRCEDRLERLVERALQEGAHVVCITPEPLQGNGIHSFGKSTPVPCYNIDGSTLKTMLRAHTGIVVLDDGVIADKRNCRDID